MRHIVLVATLAASVVAGMSIASAITSDRPDPVRAEQRDARPASPVAVSATARHPNGRDTLGVVAYRNAAGYRCFTEGVVRNGRVGAQHGRRFTEMPLDQGALCNPAPNPVSFSFTSSASGSVLFGIADDQVESLTVTAEQLQRAVRPADDGAFVIAFARRVASETEIRVRMRDGSEQVLEVPARRSPEELAAEALRNAPAVFADR